MEINPITLSQNRTSFRTVDRSTVTISRSSRSHLIWLMVGNKASFKASFPIGLHASNRDAPIAR